MAKFPLGQIVITPTAFDAMERIDDTCATLMINRHRNGDWGDIAPEDKGLNNQAVDVGERIFSVYTLGPTTFWVITEADRSATTILLPEDY